jgi:hypothetical protein
MEALEDCIPEAGAPKSEAENENDFDHDEEGLSDDEEDTVELATFSQKSNTRTSKKHKRMTISLDIVRQQIHFLSCWKAHNIVSFFIFLAHFEGRLPY